MPIEIKELNIRINVTDSQSKPESGNSAGEMETQNSLIAQCVEQVLEILSKTKER
jgi:hypothetical protein